MDSRGKIFEWRFSLIETLGFGFSLASLAVGITLWSMTTFQSKEDAKQAKLSMESRILTLEQQMETLRTSIEGVAKDVSYIRGRLEPQPK